MNIEIKTNSLRNDANIMTDELELLKSNMAAMNDAISSMNTMWKGEANAVFVSQYASDYQKMSEMCSTLARFIECLNYAASKYDECDINVKNIVKSIKI